MLVSLGQAICTHKRFPPLANKIHPNTKRKVQSNPKSHSLSCVLEYPNNPVNVGAILRTIDACGINTLYIVSTALKFNALKHASASAWKWCYIHWFRTTQGCLAYLRHKNFVSLVTSPHFLHKNSNQSPLCLYETDFRKYKRIAIWFGNESRGVSPDAIRGADNSVFVPMGGIVESLNLGVCAGVIMHYVAYQRSLAYKSKGTRIRPKE